MTGTEWTAVATGGWFGPTERPLFGWLHRPSAEPKGAVVLCSPLGRQGMSAHDAYRVLAEQLAAAGLVALRFDLDGTGDAAGDDKDPERVAHWLTSIEHAVALARGQTEGPLALIGLHSGALLAASALPRLGEVAALVLWDANPSGRALVRQQRALQLLQFGEIDDSDDGLGLPGWWVRKDTAADLEALPDKGAPGRPGRVLVLCRPSASAPRRLLGRIESDEVLVEQVEGQEELLDVELLDRRIPMATLERVTAFVAQALGAGQPRRPPREIWRAGGDPLRPEATIDVGGHRVRERLIEVGPQRLVGVASEPADADHEASAGHGAPPQPAVVFLTTSRDSHAGPSRLWTDLARRWAALGVSSLRFDASGIADSPTPPGRPPFVVRHPDTFDDVSWAARTASPEDPTNVVLVGLCAGAYQALDSALQLKPAGVMAVNPLLRFAPPEFTWGRLDRRRALCRPPHPLALSSRRLQVSLWRRGLWWAVWRLTHLPRTKAAKTRFVGQLARDGVDVYCVCGGLDRESLLFGRPPRVPGDAPGTFTLQEVADLDHAVVPTRDRTLVAALLTEHLWDRFGTPRDAGGLHPRGHSGARKEGMARHSDPGEGVHRTLPPAVLSR